ncbi:MAG: adenosine kinase, partial [Actinobacteria bacterium]|nr:adenosine kinase [Actinomycetota bacterium]
MALIDSGQADRLYDEMAPAVEISGGSTANTMVGLASLGASSAFIGRVHDDQLGEVFSHDLHAAGVHVSTSTASDGPPTGRCLILVTPDAERTLNTFLGAASEIDENDIDEELISQAKITYLEGYLYDQ